MTVGNDCIESLDPDSSNCLRQCCNQLGSLLRRYLFSEIDLREMDESLLLESHSTLQESVQLFDG